MFVYRRSTSQAVAAVSQAGKLDADSGIVIRCVKFSHNIYNRPVMYTSNKQSVITVNDIPCPEILTEPIAV